MSVLRTFILSICFVSLIVQKISAQNYEKNIEFFNLKAKDFVKENRFDSAKKYFNVYLEQSRAVSDKKAESKALANLANLEKHLHSYGKSVEFFRSAVALNEKIEDRHELMRLYSELASVYIEMQNFEDAEYYCNKSWNLTDKFQDIPLKAQVDEQLGLIYYYKNQYEKSAGKYKEAVHFYRINSNFDKLSIVLSNLALVADIQGEQDSSAHYLELALIYAEKSKDKVSYALSINNLGQILFKLSDFDRAIHYFEEADSIFNKNNLIGEHIKTINNIATVWLQKRDFDKAEKSFLETLKLIKKYNNNSNYKALVYSNLSLMYDNKKEFFKSIMYADSAVLSYQLENNPKSTAEILFLLASLYNKINNTSKAISILEQSIPFAIMSKNNPLILKIEKTLAKIYYFNKQYEKSAELLIDYQSRNDTFIKSNLSKQIADLENRILNIKKQSQIKELQYKNRQMQLVDDARKNYIFLITLLIVGVVIFSIILAFYSLKTRKAYIKLVEKNKVISDYNLISKPIEENIVKEEVESEIKKPELVEQIIELFEQGEIWKNKDLTLNMLADTLETNTNYLSEALTKIYHKNFKTIIRVRP